MQKISGGVIAPKGFRAIGVAGGIKLSGRKDISLIISDVSCVAAGVFTTNIFKAAPVIVSQEILEKNPTDIRGIVANSGNANCLTGEKGINDARVMGMIVEEKMGFAKNTVLVASTGIIGKFLPMEVVEYGIAKACDKIKQESSSISAAEGIMTTDTRPKEVAVQYISGLETFKIGAIGKGSGMINPSMATMLCFITTDVKISKELLQSALSETVKDTFNSISVDGDMSTNDTVFILASGLSEFTVNKKDEKYKIFVSYLKEVMNSMALMIVEDGEGITKVIKIEVINARKKQSAENIARKIANSLLVKTMFFGENPNWGRIISAIGSTKENIDPYKLKVVINQKKIYDKGSYIGYPSNDILKERYINLIVDLGIGKETFTLYTNDLSYDYIKINAEYT
ncbi:MAG: bifunctional glutamate N-acetyltransferase/amino-acid acetyltransferase ArgJ [Spirochaetia bacterium]|nr:bifunctional glutamate N-acetyltransferase/amino-acid acetyltransferase ArgJ [Spirochaetota bacterium]MCX8097089.1 bifunctional glutamate N-acetyltransferase/amino-acid acetyltransferase ArgJ [Spirochaetota bacterium]MDW8112660.1 bifunctional glutamate N-acetyltransferase/amino-acid acetyltransferase ArgJ [Spirochaetia bacterium]